MRHRLLELVALLILAMLAGTAHASCTNLGQNVSATSIHWQCVTTTEAQAKIRPVAVAACQNQYGSGFTVADSNVGNDTTVKAWYSDGHCADPNNGSLHYIGYDRADYTDATTSCTAGNNGLWAIFSNAGGAPPTAPATICTQQNCLANFAPNGTPSYIASAEAWRQDGSYTLTGATCTDPTPPPSTPPPLPDADHDGIPDNIDPYPNDPTNTPPPPPTPPPQNPPPTPPTDQPATNNDISNLVKVIGDKLDALDRAIAGLKAAVDASASSQAAANAANAASIVNAISGIPGGTAGGTDMSATNAKLDTIINNTNRPTATAADCASATVTCAGDQVLCATFNEQHKLRCAQEALNAHTGTIDHSYGDEGIDPHSVVKSADGSGIGAMLDTNYVNFSNTSCPAFPAINIGAQVFQIPESDGFCSFLAVIRTILIGAALFQAISIVMR